MAVAIPTPRRIKRGLRWLPFGRSAAKEMLISEQPASPFAEAFRLLAINVRAIFADSPNQAVVVMSAFPEEGRSMVAANLALALGEQGPVLLVPEPPRADRPFPWRGLLSAGSAKGSSNGHNAGAYSSISIKATSHANVSMLDWSSGPMRNATELMEEVRRANAAGTFVVLDSPPAFSASEAYLLAQQVGNALYVVPDRVQDMKVHEQIKEHLHRLKVRIAGVIVNEA
jgi:Mrp family chromosome partitioning ATPase